MQQPPDLNLLFTLEALLADPHLGRAAQRLGLTVSAVSRALGRLRRLLGDPLIVRGGARVRLTPKAMELAGRLPALLAEMRALLAPSDMGPPVGEILLRTSDFGANLVLPILAPQLASEAPGLHLRVLSGAADDTAQLGEGPPQLLLGVYGELAPHLRVRTIGESGFVVVMHSQHPALAGPWDAKHFAALSHLRLAVRGEPQTRLDAVMAEQGLRRHVIISLGQLMAALEMVVRGPWVLTLWKPLARHWAPRLNLAIRPLPIDLPPTPLRLVWHPRDDRVAGHLWLRQAVARIVKQELDAV